MATIKVKFRTSSVKDKDGTLFYQIIHLREVKQIYPDLHISQDEWNEESSSVIIPKSGDSNRIALLTKVKERIDSDIVKLKAIVSNLGCSGKAFSVDTIVAEFNAPVAVIGVVSFAKRLIENLKKMGKKATVKRYTIALNSFMRFTENKEIAWGDFNSTLLLGYEEFLMKRGLCRNSTSFYMRNLRSIVNRAIEEDYDLPRNPFKHVYMGVDKTVKRAVPLKTVCMIRDLDLSEQPHLDFARNVFMFSFYTRGMSFVDIAFLKKTDVRNGVITYFRRKTRQRIQVKIESQTLQLMEKMGESKSGFLLPIITDDGDTNSQYENAYHRINRNLKEIGKMLGLDIKLTMYVARHAWASIAHNNNVPVSTISKAMGHNSEATTMIYLSSLDMSVVDKANRKIMTLMNGGQAE